MTATDELRRLLDERGVEWMDDSYAQLWCTVWHGQDGKQWRMTENQSGMLTELKAWKATPAQAIEATLGSSNCTNSERTNGTCKNIHEPPRDTTFWPVPHFKCSECGATHVSMEYVYFCPNCGRKVVDE